MDKITQILQAAQARAKEMNLPYKGALLPAEAFDLLQSKQGAKLIDVRTHAEWDWVGRVPSAVEIEWVSYPDMQHNPHFLAELQQQAGKEVPVLFICRSGARSHSAAIAAAQAGYTDSYNVLEGFEGDKDSNQRRNHINGWRAAGLPWEQS